MSIILRLRNVTQADPARGWVPAEFYDIVVGETVVGAIQLRLGNTDALRLYGGHVGYAVDPEYRGHGYAGAALRQILPIAAGHGFTELWITCRPDAIASQRTLAKAGATWVETLAVPQSSDLYARGDVLMRRYRLAV